MSVRKKANRIFYKTVLRLRVIHRNVNKSSDMKSAILKCLIAVLCTSIIVNGCKKTDAGITQSQGVITPDYGYCALCGGYFISFNTDSNTKYRIKNDITPFGIFPNSKFPVYVDVNWKPDTSAKSGQYVLITSLRIKNWSGLLPSVIAFVRPGALTPRYRLCYFTDKITDILMSIFQFYCLIKYINCPTNLTNKVCRLPSRGVAYA